MQEGGSIHSCNDNVALVITMWLGLQTRERIISGERPLSFILVNVVNCFSGIVEKEPLFQVLCPCYGSVIKLQNIIDAT